MKEGMMPFNITIAAEKAAATEELVKKYNWEISQVLQVGSEMPVGSADGQIVIEEGDVGIMILRPIDAVYNGSLIEFQIELNQLLEPATTK